MFTGWVPQPSRPTWMQSRDHGNDMEIQGATQGTALQQLPSTLASLADFPSQFHAPFFCILGFWQRLLCAGICCNTEPVDWAVFGSHCCDKFLPISPIFQACARPGESRRGAQVGAAWGSIIKQVACTGCESLKAPSSPDSALPIRKALPKGQVQTGTPVLSSYTFLL